MNKTTQHSPATVEKYFLFLLENTHKRKRKHTKTEMSCFCYVIIINAITTVKLGDSLSFFCVCVYFLHFFFSSSLGKH